MSELPDGRVAWRLKQPGGRGETHRIMEPMEFMARLAALVPPPRHPLVRYHGVFAPHSRWRAAVVPGPRPQELERRMKACAAKAKSASEAATGAVGVAMAVVGAGRRGRRQTPVSGTPSRRAARQR